MGINLESVARTQKKPFALSCELVEQSKGERFFLRSPIGCEIFRDTLNTLREK